MLKKLSLDRTATNENTKSHIDAVEQELHPQKDLIEEIAFDYVDNLMRVAEKSI